MNITVLRDDLGNGNGLADCHRAVDLHGHIPAGGTFPPYRRTVPILGLSEQRFRFLIAHPSRVVIEECYSPGCFIVNFLIFYT